MAKIQHGLIAAQDIGDDKLVTVQAMSDLIENKARQLEHDSKILDFGKDDYDEPQAPTAKNSSNSSANQNYGGSQVSSSSKTSQQSSANKTVKEKDSKEMKPQGIKRRKKQVVESKSRADDQDDDEASTVSNRSGGGSRPRGNLSAVGSKRQGVKRKSTGKRSSNFNDKDDSDREVDLSNIDIDPDEPTYCLCEQVIYISTNFKLALTNSFSRCHMEK